MSSEPAAGEPAMIVDVPVGHAPAEQALGAVDAILGGDLGHVAVRLLVEDGHPERDVLAELCGGDPRLQLAAADEPPVPDVARAVVPPSARPSERTLGALAELLAEGSVGAVEVAIPGRLSALARTSAPARAPGTNRLRAERPGGGRTLRVSARRVGLGSARSPAGDPPPPAGLSGERAEHLRHRARSATGRARLDRNAQRLTRERMRVQHERARASLLDERLAAVSARHRVGRWARKARRLALGVPLRLWSLVGAGRTYGRRARRFLRDRARQRRSPAPRQ
jgi:hypothetical protein